MARRPLQHRSVQRRLVRRMRELCEDRGIVYSHLPDYADVGQTHFWAVTKLDSTPSLEWMCKIAKALDVDIVELLER